MTFGMERSTKGGPFTPLTTNRQLELHLLPPDRMYNYSNTPQHDKERNRRERNGEGKKNRRGTYLTRFTTELCVIYGTLYFLTFSSLSLR